MFREQKSGSPKPRQKGGKRDGINRGNLPAVDHAMCMNSATRVRATHMPVQAGDMKMKMRQVQVQSARQEHQHAEKESNNEADQIKISPGHGLLLVWRGPALSNFEG